MISGKPVSSDTSRTARPASAMRLGRAAGGDQLDAGLDQPAAKSSRPVLSETDSSARRDRHEIGRGDVLGGDGHGRAAFHGCDGDDARR